jgi:hypothetical protein
MATNSDPAGKHGILDEGGVLDGDGISRRQVLTRSAALGGALAVGTTLAGASPALAKAGPRQANGPKTKLPPPPPAAPKELQVEMVPLSHGDLAMTGEKWLDNGFTFGNHPLWFYWGYVRGLPGQKNPILLIRSYTNGPAAGPLTHWEFQPGLFRTGLDLSTNAGTMFSAPAGASFVGALDPGGYHQLTNNTPGSPGVPPNPADPDNLGGPNERTYEMSGSAADGSSLLYRAGTKAHRFVETTAGGKLLCDIRADYTPLTPAISAPAPFNTYFTGAATAQGKYRGHDVWFMSGWDRFMDQNTFLPVFANPIYIAFVFSGIDKHGVREWGASYFTGQSSTNYSSFGAYCREGEEPICSHEVKTDITYVSNANDPTKISPLKGVYRWTDLNNGKSVEIHATGTHSGLIGGGTNEVFLDWHEKHGAQKFVRSMAVWETSIHPGSVPISGTYTPSTAPQ